MCKDPVAFEKEYAAITAPEITVAPKVKKPKKVIDDDSQDEEFTTVGKDGKAMHFTPESIFKNLQMVQEARGKKVSIIHLALVCCTEPKLSRTLIGRSKFVFWRNCWMSR